MNEEINKINKNSNNNIEQLRYNPGEGAKMMTGYIESCAHH